MDKSCKYGTHTEETNEKPIKILQFLILYSKPGAPDYKECIESYLKIFEDDEISSSDKVEPLLVFVAHTVLIAIVMLTSW